MHCRMVLPRRTTVYRGLLGLSLSCLELSPTSPWMPKGNSCVKNMNMMKTATESGDGTIHTTYIAADDNTILNKHDILKVKITEKSSTPYKRLLNVVLRMDDNPYKLEMAKMVK